MSNDVARGRRAPLLAAGYDIPKRTGFGVASAGGGSWNGPGGPREEINDSMLAMFPMQPMTFRQSQAKRAYHRCQWAYKGNAAYSSCVDLITQSMLTNGEDYNRRPWRLAPARDDHDEPIENPDEAQLEPFFTFVKNCHPNLSFENILTPVITDWNSANNVYVEVALSPILNPYGVGQPGALYLLPQAEIYPKVTPKGELDPSFPFYQLRDGKQETTKAFTWPQIFQAMRGSMRGPGILPLAPVDTIEVPIESTIQAGKLIRSFFRTGFKSGAAFENEKWEQSDAEDFLQFLKQHYTDTEDGHQPMVFWGGVKPATMPQSFVDFEKFIGIINANRNDVCSRFQTNPRLVVAVEARSALGSKGDTQHDWHRFLSSNVNQRKREFSTAFTHQILGQGFGITDWRWELVPYPEFEDAAEFAQIAAGMVAAITGGIINKRSPEDMTIARRRLDSELSEVTQETLDLWEEQNKAAAADAMGDAGGQPGEGGQPPPKDDPKAKPVPPAPVEGRRAPESDAWIEARRASARKKKPHPHAEEARGSMDSWTASTAKQTHARLAESVVRAVSALKPIYDAAHSSGFTDARKAEFEKAIAKLPGGGAVLVNVRASMKSLYGDAHKQATAQIKKAAREAAGKRDAVRAKGTVDNFIEMLGAHYFDDLYNDVTSELRSTFIDGIGYGWDLDEFVARVTAGAEEVASEAQITSIVRTASTDILNIGRQHAAQESDIVSAYEYSAILDDRVTPTCEAADGLVIALYDPNVDRLRPPNHFNCRCVYTFRLKGEPVTLSSPEDIGRVLAMVPPEFGGARKAA